VVASLWDCGANGGPAHTHLALNLLLTKAKEISLFVLECIRLVSVINCFQ
jgi:hypothetical protein